MLILVCVCVFPAPPALTTWKATLVRQSSRLLVACRCQRSKSPFWVGLRSFQTSDLSQQLGQRVSSKIALLQLKRIFSEQMNEMNVKLIQMLEGFLLF